MRTELDGIKIRHTPRVSLRVFGEMSHWTDWRRVWHDREQNITFDQQPPPVTRLVPYRPPPSIHPDPPLVIMAAPVGVLPVASIQLDYADELEKITQFLSTYVPPPRDPRTTLPADDDEEAEDELADDMDDLDFDGDSDGNEQGQRSKAKYMRVLRKVANRQTAEVVVDLADLRKVGMKLFGRMMCTDDQYSNDTSLLANILKNTRRYIQLFCDAIDKLMPLPDAEMDYTEDVLDLIMQQRRERNDQLVNGERTEGGMFPPELMRR